jgi:hypothetical protein
MALARWILGKFLGVVCQCFPLPLDVRTFAARCIHVPNNASAPNSERWNCGREWCPVTLPKLRPFYAILGICPLRRKACLGFFRPKNLTASTGVEPDASMQTTRPPKPFSVTYQSQKTAIKHRATYDVVSRSSYPLARYVTFNRYNPLEGALHLP